MKTNQSRLLTTSLALLVGLPSTTFKAAAGWTPPESSVTPPAVLTIDPFTAPLWFGASPQTPLVLGPDGAMYGSTPGGNGGTLFKLATDGTFINLHDFTGADGSSPAGALVAASDGAFYGTTTYGGANNVGTLFKLATDGTFTKLHDFNGTDGNTAAALVQGPDGALYGSTPNGGSSGVGTLFKIQTDGTFTKLHDFNGTGGSSPVAPLVQGPDQALYGSTPNGGTGGVGTLFKVQTDGTFTKLHDFSGNDGSNPGVGLVVSLDGLLYGLAQSGGTTGNGTVFSVAPDGTFNKLHDFSSADGSIPPNRLTVGPDGALYGTTFDGGTIGFGSIFRLGTDGTFTVLHEFNGADGSTMNLNFDGNPDLPCPELVLGPAGALFGSTSYGGAGNAGTLFRIATDGTFTVLHDFADVAQRTALVAGSDGALYGSTPNEGPGHLGTLFKLDTAGLFIDLHDFAASTDGSFPSDIGSLTAGPDGAMYGSTLAGGVNGSGTLFKVETNGTFTQLHDMSSSEGGSRMTTLVAGPDGFLYGSSQQGGVNGNHGTLFKLGTDGTFAKLHDFSGLDGSTPEDPLVVGQDGALYGVTALGGTSDVGTLFKIDTHGTFTKLHDLTSIEGENPAGVLVVGPDGTLYGLANSGGASGNGTRFSGSGTLFKIQSNGAFTKLHDFIGSDGQHPMTLVMGPDGALYGCTHQGGTTGNGTLFRLETNGTFTKLHDFSGTDGGGPVAALVIGPDGGLYGSTSLGGSNADGTFYSGFGTLFRLGTDGAFTKFHDFNGTDGAYPQAALVVRPDGALYGAAQYGASTNGTIFKLTIDGTFTKLHDFSGADGSYIPGALVAGPDGALYGTTLSSGPRGGGTLFKVVLAVVPKTPVISWTTPSDIIYGTLLDGTQLNASASFNGSPVPGTFAYTPPAGTWLDVGNSQTLSVTFTPGDAVHYTPVTATVAINVLDAAPVNVSLSPASATAGGAAFILTVNGSYFDPGTVVYWNGGSRPTTFLNRNQVTAQISATDLQVGGDFVTALVTVTKSTGLTSQPVGFTIVGTSISGAVSQVQSGVAAAGQTATVQTLPSTSTSAGVSASFQNNTLNSTPAAVTAATYTQNPTPSQAFDAGGGFVDLKVSGATASDQLTSLFYYPQTVTGAAETALTLQFFNGTQWISVLSSGGVSPIKNTTDNLDTTVSGGRFQVVFDDTSTPKLTELNGTVFAVAVPDTTPPSITCQNISVACDTLLLVPVTYPTPAVSDNVDPSPRVTYSIPSGTGFPIGTTTVTATATDAAGNHSSTTFTVTRAALQLTGFLSPIGGADSTGGSFSAPLRTFKAGSTIPVKFTAQCGGAAVTSGIHRLQAVKYTSATTAGTPIDATPQGAATTGDQFQFSSGQWQFNLDTKATGMTTGIWQLAATLSDGSQHSVWIQLK